jgi:hypothetical protein
MNVKDFINVFNEYYPFERYIMKQPKKINSLFDDAYLTEIFIPSIEIKPVLHNGKIVCFTEIPKDEIYVKVKGSTGEMRFALFDFSDSVIDGIIWFVILDLGHYEWESLYVEHEDGSEDLKIALFEQKRLIAEKYGECDIKDTINTKLL